MKYLFLSFLMFPIVGMATTCPSGMVAYEYDAYVPTVAGVCPAGYVAHDVSDVCSVGATGACWLVRVLCGAGITTLNTSGGLSFPLYSDKSTSPSIHIKYNDSTCYADLEVGVATGAFHVKYNDIVYHTVSE